MRTGLPKTLTERRHARRHRSRPAAPRAHEHAAPLAGAPSALARTREAGGPIDCASYNCQCGYVFVAQVSTTVTCPHCQTGQVW